MSLVRDCGILCGRGGGGAYHCACGVRRVLRCGGGRLPLSLSLKRPGEVLPVRDE